jgi:hypothetical protein
MTMAGIINAQSPGETDRIQAVIGGLRAEHQTAAISEWSRTWPGVMWVRVEFNTRNMVMQVRNDCPLSYEQLRDQVEAMGFTLRCYERVPFTTPFRMLDARRCDELPSVK